MEVIHLVEESDFIVKSIPDGVAYGVDRHALARESQVFGDMFAVCHEPKDESTNSVDLDEPSNTLSMFLRLVLLPDAECSSKEIPPGSAIPLPLIPKLLALCVKYMVSERIFDLLRLHLSTYASTFPMHVYGYASHMGWDELATKASKHLHAPLSSYSTEDIAMLPDAQALHKLVRLHDYRTAELRKLLMGEELFPHGYGKCTTRGHAPALEAQWESLKAGLRDRIRADTDVAAGMAPISGCVQGECAACTKACNAALEMLAYKCRRAPRRIGQVPPEL